MNLKRKDDYLKEFLGFSNFSFYENYELYQNHVLTLKLSDLDTDDLCYVLECYSKAVSLFENVFFDSDNIIFVSNIYQDDGIIYRPRRIKSYLRNKKLNSALNCLESNCLDGGYEKYIHYYLRCQIRDINYKKLILHLCQHEMGYDVKPMNDYYFINLDKNYCFRMLNDSFIDLIFKNPEDKKIFLNRFSELNERKDLIKE